VRHRPLALTVARHLGTQRACLEGKRQKDHHSNASERIYRVDKFIVPDHAREEFMRRVRDTHELLRTLPGFLQDFVLEQSSGPGEFNFVTSVEWDGVESVENAKAFAMAMQKEMNFNPQEMWARLEIKTDLANYRQIDT
jgi:heme-degrading monooxygenase HmoA